MPLFPAFLDLSERTVLVAGEGREADAKAEKMAPFCEKVVRCPYPPRYDTVPALSALLRRRIEEALPEDLEAIAEAAAELTMELRKTIPDPHERGKALRERLRALL